MSNSNDIPNPPAPDESADIAAMDEELRQRREQTWEMLVIQDREYGEVVGVLADEYDVTRRAIEQDISKMGDWLPKLDQMSTKSGASRLRELRHNRKRRREILHEMQDDEDTDPKEELRVLSQLDQAIEMDVRLSQSLGETEREPQEHITHRREQVEHQLSDNQEEHLNSLKEWARGQTVERDDEIIEVENLEDDEDEGEG